MLLLFPPMVFPSTPLTEARACSVAFLASSSCPGGCIFFWIDGCLTFHLDSLSWLIVHVCLKDFLNHLTVISHLLCNQTRFISPVWYILFAQFKFLNLESVCLNTFFPFIQLVTNSYSFHFWTHLSSAPLGSDNLLEWHIALLKVFVAWLPL